MLFKYEKIKNSTIFNKKQKHYIKYKKALSTKCAADIAKAM